MKYYIIWTKDGVPITDRFEGEINIRGCTAKAHVSNVLKKHFGSQDNIKKCMDEGSLKIIYEREPTGT